MSFQLTDGRFKAFDSLGIPLVGGLLLTCASGTTTPKVTYTDATRVTANPTTITLNARGEAQVWLGTGAYTFILKDALGVTIWTTDGVEDPADATAAAIGQLALPAGAAAIGFDPAGGGALGTVEFVLRMMGKVFAPLYPNLQAAIDAASAHGGGCVVVPRLSPTSITNIGIAGISIPSNVHVEGDSWRYVKDTSRGTVLQYSGTGKGVSFDGVLNAGMSRITLDCSAAAGGAVQGISVTGAWWLRIDQVAVIGVTPKKGYSIHGTCSSSTDVAFGMLMCELSNIEAPDGVIRFEGVTGSNSITTSVLRNVRGYQFEFDKWAQMDCENLVPEADGPNGAPSNGAYQAGLTYEPSHSCVNGGVFYYCIATTTGNAPPNASFWYPLSGVGIYANTGTRISMRGNDYEGCWLVGLAIDPTSTTSNEDAIWQGFGGPVRVQGTTAPLASYGGQLQYINDQLTAGAAVTLESASDANTDFVGEELMPVNVAGGSQEGYRRFWRRIAGAKVYTHELQRDFVFEHTKTFSAAAATLVLNLAPTNGHGIYLECQAEGTQVADQVHSVFVRLVARNSGGTVAFTADAPLTIPAAYAGVFTFANNAGTLDVKWTPTTANASPINFTFRVRGALTSYTKA